VLPQWASTRLRQDYGLSTQPVRQTVETFNSLNQRKLQVYTPWNLHEPYPGHFDWEGVADIERWIALIKVLQTSFAGSYAHLTTTPC
jgi:hypothetical protein